MSIKLANKTIELVSKKFIVVVVVVVAAVGMPHERVR